MKAIAFVFLGAGIGGVLRHGLNVAALRAFGPGFPWATLGVNVAGSLLMGLVAGWLEVKAPGDAAHPLRLFLATGVLGGFTTFSAFSLDAVVLWQRGETWLAIAYMGGSVILSIAGLLVGLAAVRAMSLDETGGARTERNHSPPGGSEALAKKSSRVGHAPHKAR